MLKTIELFNFQSHESTILDFGPGLNIITGSSDSGKTAIMRFILWVLNNRPLGEEFKSWDTKEDDNVGGGIAFSEGTYVTKERAKGKNIYNINGTILEAIKSDIPDELKAITNIVDYNIQTQHQPYFLLQDSPGEVARKLNELIGLDVIDTIFSNLNSSIRDLKGKGIDLDNQIKILTNQIESLSFLDEIQVIVNRLEQDVIRQNKIESESRGLLSVISSIEDLNRQISEIEIDLELEKATIDLLSLIKDYQVKEKVAFSLNSTLRNLTTLEETLTAESEWLSVEDSYLEIKELIAKDSALMLDCNTLESRLNNISNANQAFLSESSHLSLLEIDHRNLLKKAKICPFCKTPITDKTIKQIEESL